MASFNLHEIVKFTDVKDTVNRHVGKVNPSAKSNIIWTPTDNESSKVTISPYQDLTLFYGGSGAGKTRISTMLFHAYRAPDNELAFADAKVSCQLVGLNDNDSPEVLLINANEESQSMRRWIQSDTNSQDLIEGVDPVVFETAFTSIVNQVLGRTFSSIEIFEISEISDLFGDLDDFGARINPPAPKFGEYNLYVKVKEVPSRKSPTLERNLTELGQTELAVIFTLYRISKANPGDLVIIDSPLLGLPSEKSIDFAYFLDYLAIKLRISMFIFTADIVPFSFLGSNCFNAIDKSHFTFEQENMAYDDLPIHDSISRRTFNIFVEDTVAGEFLAELFLRFNTRLFRSCNILMAKNGESSLSQLLELRPVFESPRYASPVVVFDGDQRSNQRNLEEYPNDNFYFLPGKNSPEAELRRVSAKAIDDGSADDILSGLTKEDRNSFKRALKEAETREDHDWYKEICKSYSNASSRSTMSLLITICLKNREFYGASKNLVSDLRKLFSVITNRSILI